MLIALIDAGANALHVDRQTDCGAKRILADDEHVATIVLERPADSVEPTRRTWKPNSACATSNW
jgi:hypothetical protein